MLERALDSVLPGRHVEAYFDLLLKTTQTMCRRKPPGRPDDVAHGLAGRGALEKDLERASLDGCAARAGYKRGTRRRLPAYTWSIGLALHSCSHAAPDPRRGTNLSPYPPCPRHDTPFCSFLPAFPPCQGSDGRQRPSPCCAAPLRRSLRRTLRTGTMCRCSFFSD